VMTAVVDWLERNHEQPQFYLHVDCFDVHEPFHVPEPYRSMYTDADYRRYSPWPIYGRIDSPPARLEQDEVEWVRAQFAGKLTMVDRWLGRVFDKLDEHRLLDRTAVIITTDHGHYLGEHRRIGKPLSPLFHTLCHIPLLVSIPGEKSHRIDAITQTVDHYATVLDLFGIEPPQSKHVHSRSYLPCLLDGKPDHRPYAVYGYNNRLTGITAGNWTLLRDHDGDAAPAYAYTHQVEQVNGFGIYTRKHWRRTDFSDLESGRFIPGVDMPVWKMKLQSSYPPPRPDLLFDNAGDPSQENDLAARRPDQVNALAALLRDHAHALGAPEEQFKRLKLA
jgi:arylsulfatase A-like enzyme